MTKTTLIIFLRIYQNFISFRITPVQRFFHPSLLFFLCSTPIPIASVSSSSLPTYSILSLSSSSFPASSFSDVLSSLQITTPPSSLYSYICTNYESLLLRFFSNQTPPLKLTVNPFTFADFEVFVFYL